MHCQHNTMTLNGLEQLEQFVRHRVFSVENRTDVTHIDKELVDVMVSVPRVLSEELCRLFRESDDPEIRRLAISSTDGRMPSKTSLLNANVAENHKFSDIIKAYETLSMCTSALVPCDRVCPVLRDVIPSCWAQIPRCHVADELIVTSAAHYRSFDMLSELVRVADVNPMGGVSMLPFLKALKDRAYDTCLLLIDVAVAHDKMNEHVRNAIAAWVVEEGLVSPPNTVAPGATIADLRSIIRQRSDATTRGIVFPLRQKRWYEEGGDEAMEEYIRVHNAKVEEEQGPLHMEPFTFADFQKQSNLMRQGKFVDIWELTGRVPPTPR